MKVEKKSIDTTKLELTITVPADQMEKFAQKAANQISKSVKLDGFRAGHVPYEVIKQKVGEMEIYQEAANIAINETFIDTVQMEKVFFVGNPEIHVDEVAPKNEMVYRAIVTLLPAISLPDFDSMKKIERKNTVIRDEDLEKALTELQKMHKKETARQGKAEKGDKIVITFDIFRDNVLIDNGHYDKFAVEIGENMMIPGFEDELIGLAPKDKKEFEITFPEKYHEPTLAGKLAKFAITVDDVLTRELPTLDDAFAKSLGKFENMEELKKQIENNLNLEAKNRDEQKQEQEIIELVVKSSKINEIPEMLIDSEKQRMLDEMKGYVGKERLKWEDYLTHMKKTEEEIKDGYKNQAIERVKTGLVLREVGAVHKITASPEDINKEIHEAQEYYREKNPKLLEKVQSEDYREHIENMLTNKKIVDFLQEKLLEEPSTKIESKENTGLKEKISEDSSGSKAL